MTRRMAELRLFAVTRWWSSMSSVARLVKQNENVLIDSFSNDILLLRLYWTMEWRLHTTSALSPLVMKPLPNFEKFCHLFKIFYFRLQVVDLRICPRWATHRMMSRSTWRCSATLTTSAGSRPSPARCNRLPSLAVDSSAANSPVPSAAKVCSFSLWSLLLALEFVND